jgi:hypothetical protein
MENIMTKLNISKKFSVAVGAAMLLASGGANAVIVGGYNFDDNAFADSLDFANSSLANSLVWTNGGNISNPTNAQLENSVIGNDINQGIFLAGSDYATLSFDDNLIFNGAGADFVVFEIGAPAEAADISVDLGGGISLSYATSWTGVSNGTYNLNAVAIDMSDFGIASGATASWVSVINTRDTFDLTLIGALNNASVPEPSILMLLSLGLLGIGAVSRRRAS